MPYTGSTVAILIMRLDQVLMVQRPSDSSYDPSLWEFPHGTVESGETLEQAVTRVALTVTGLSVNAGTAMVATTIPNYQTVDQLWIDYPFSCTVLPATPLTLNPAYTLAWLSLIQVEQLVVHGQTTRWARIDWLKYAMSIKLYPEYS